MAFRISSWLPFSTGIRYFIVDSGSECSEAAQIILCAAMKNYDPNTHRETAIQDQRGTKQMTVRREGGKTIYGSPMN